ncbi:MAG TPA: glycosyltransferase [Candidatus Eubacterium avistercoris]|uniref:Glycosyltransferase n=1 Tax=Candidatus Eubacterium avistercoris TaxID=2838567 RepID=A0A9D2D3P1_9FIRM|nr:glycosyltransferase [Candidatus Eubacterium avistercoris]
MLEHLITTIGNAYPSYQAVYAMIGSVMTVLFFYKKIYKIMGIFFTRKFKPAKHNHKYAILIPARNEEAVIANLLDSIHKQDYDMSLVTVFVVADNCTDRTAEIARKCGAICYERFDDEHRTKGYALQFLFERIEEDYGRMSFEGYFIFDADNLLKEDYISRMNDSFDAGCKLITSYRNSKNFSESWVASTYALHWLRSIRTNHRPRSVLRLATNIQGTGFLFTNEIVRDGWKYTSLTEDRALTADAVAQGFEITYNDKAVFYDEQPVSVKVALRQRLRWSRGHLEAFVETGPYLFLNIFFGKLLVKTKWKRETVSFKDKGPVKGTLLALLESIRHRAASFDTLVQLTPVSLINIVRWLLISFFIYGCACYVNGIDDLSWITTGSWLGKLLRNFINPLLQVDSGWQALGLGLLMAFWRRLFYRIADYLENCLTAVYLFIIEYKRMIRIPLRKKILYCLTWPTFDIIGRWTIYLAVFKKVSWKTIPHQSQVTIDDIRQETVQRKAV